ncbi:MAG: type II toxin-antitoxin system ParD family antitoxin [Saprospiraceae bacterium]
MQRIKLGKPYEDYIEKQIQAGYFSTATEVIRDSLRAKMVENEKNRIAQIHRLIEKGMQSVRTGKTIPFTPETMKEIFEQAKVKVKNNATIPDHVKP